MPRVRDSSDLFLAALLEAQEDAHARSLGRYDAMGTLIPRTIDQVIDAGDRMAKRRELELKAGTPQRGRAPAFSVGSPPADPRRRIPILNIPLGRLPEARFATQEDGVPAELLDEAIRTQQPVYFRPGSRNYRPARIGLDEFKERADLLPQIDVADPGSVEALLTEPDREKALKGVKIRGSRHRGGRLLPVTGEMRSASEEVYGYDIFGDLQDTDEVTNRRLLQDLERKRRPSTKYTEVKIQQILSKGNVSELNQLADDLRTELLNHEEYRIRLDDDEAAEKKKLLADVMKKRQARLGLGKNPPNSNPDSGAPADDPNARVRVISPSGQTGTIPKSKLQEKLKQGYKLAK